MKLGIALLIITFITGGWQVDFDTAKKTAQQEHKYILVSFSGSDWCVPCIRMHKQIFDDPAFEQYAKDHLVLVNADFPRAKKNALPAAQQKKNDELADRYNKKGIFPLTLLASADGKVIKTWEGMPNISASDFTKQVQTILDAGK